MAGVAIDYFIILLCRAVIGIAAIVASKDKQSRPMPFGPYLAIAGWVYLVYGDSLTHLYYSLVL